MSDFEVCAIGTQSRLALVEAFASALRQQAEQSAQRLAQVEARADRAEQCAETEAKRADKAEAEFERLKRFVAFQEQTYLKHHGGSWGNCKYKVERDALLANILFQLLAAANYIDALGGDSKSYRAAIAIAKAEGGGNG